MAARHHHFRENLKALGLPAPESLFANLPLALGSAQKLMALVDRLGAKATVKDMVVAGTGLEQLSPAGAVPASYYVGALVGSLAAACGGASQLPSAPSSAAPMASPVTFCAVHRPLILPSR